MATKTHTTQPPRLAASRGLPTIRRAGSTPNPARDARHWLVTRASMAVKVHAGPWLFNKGEVLDGVLVTHPVNAFRKVIIHTDRGTFTVNEEDVEEA